MTTKTLSREGTLLATVKAAKGDGPGEFEAILSMPTLDRDGEIVDAKAFDPLPEWMNVDIDHSMSVSGTVGSGAPFYDGDVLKVKGTWASTDLAQTVRTLVVEGHVRHMSVAYMNAQYKDAEDGVPHLQKGELLNAAIVGIPANREAAILAAKSIAAKVGARNSADDQGRIQTAHDLMAELGADCATKSAHAQHTKAVAGSFEERSDRLRQALRAANPTAEWLWVRATFDDQVIYEIEAVNGTVTTWSASYTEDGDTFTFGDATEVDLAEIVVPPVKALATDPKQKAAAKAAAFPSADVARARVELALAEVALAL